MDFNAVNMSFREFFEAQVADISKLQGQSPFHLQQRRQGMLAPKDPIKRFAASTPNVGDLHIVWITGMWSGKIPGTGNYGALLKPLGYNIQTVNTKANVFAATAGRLAHGFAAPALLQRYGQAHIEKNKDLYRGKVEEKPDIIIGSSQGGAIALSLASEHPEVPMLLVCPAWRIFHVQPTHLHPDSIIVHGLYDKEVPIADSEYLAKKFNIPLFVTEDGHIIRKGFWQIIKALNIISSKVIRKKPQEQEPQWQGVTGLGSQGQQSQQMMQPQTNVSL